MHDVLALAQDTVQRYEGTLLQVSGDGFLALFGAPVAQEDHARRAVLAALELRQRLRVPEAIRGQPHGVALRLGLHTGPVVVGPLAYDPQRPYTAVGDTLPWRPGSSSRQRPTPSSSAPPPMRWCRLRSQGEVCETLPRDRPSSPVLVYAVHGLLRRWAGVPRRGARPLSPFVGRAQELALLHERLALAAQRAGAGSGHCRGARHGQVPAAGRIRPQPERAAGDVLRRPLPGLWQRHPLSAGARPATAALGPARHGRPRRPHRHHPAAAARGRDGV